MSGHSKWATIRRDKEKNDSARGATFSKLIKEITIAARMGGGDPNMNPRLRTAIAAAKGANMPSANVDRAIKKGTGELPGVSYEEITYEAYGPGGTALLIEVTTDNRNRAVSEIRHMISKNNGNLGESGSVAWMFHRRGVLTIPSSAADEDTMMMAALEAGADDVKLEGDLFTVTTSPDQLETVREALIKAGITPDSAEIQQLPQTYVPVSSSDARAVIKLMEALDDHDDVQHVWSNFDIPDELMASL
jgi:YebC/PmpR family DNA-binding regulatory protein